MGRFEAAEDDRLYLPAVCPADLPRKSDNRDESDL